MDENRRQVLEMLAAEKITVEQANQLLEALGASWETRAETPAAPEHWASDAPRAQEQATPQAEGRDEWQHLLGQLLASGSDVAYIRELRDSGLIADVPHDLLVSLTMVRGGDIAYIRELRDSGLIADVPHDLLKSLAPIADVAYIRELRDADVLDLPRKVLMPMVAMRVDVARIRELRDSGLLDGPANHRPNMAGMERERDSAGANEVQEVRA